mgnify:CR=1 FL=1
MKIRTLLLALLFGLLPFINVSASETAGSDGHIYRGRYANYSDISEEDCKHIEELMKDQPFPITFGQMARYYFGHTQPLILHKEAKE